MTVKAKKLVYVDMDGVVANTRKALEAGADMDAPGFFLNLEPVYGAVSALKWLSMNFDARILSAPKWTNPNSATEKIVWIKKYTGDLYYKRVILCSDKWLLPGDFLIDDNVRFGNSNFKGSLIHFGSTSFPNWDAVITFLKDEIVN